MTIIKKLKLHGFKSFAKPTELVFGNGFNICIGPNGAGKTNVMDSLLFVLGKISSKALRVGKASNLIYNGGKKGKAAEKAEVTIAFDNSNKRFPIDAREIIISRLVKQKGQSTYRINGEIRTRQQILDLLSQANIDPEGHNIILQGDIERFINMKPIERRFLIEEIAGISVYEEKKEKAMKELEKVQTKLSEVEIILTEREANLRELKKDRDQALRYKDLESKIKQNKATALMSQIKIKEEKRNKIQSKVSEEDNKIKSIKSKIDKIKEEINSKKQEIEKINVMIEEKGEKEQIALTSSISDIKANIATNKTRLETCNNEIIKIKNRDKQLRNNLEEINKKINELENKKNQLKQKIVTINPQEKEKLKKLKEELKSTISELNRYLNEDSAYANQLGKTRENLVKSENELTRLNTRKISMEELSFADKAIKKILALKNKKVYGLVSELGRVDPEYALALEVAAGPRLKSIVVEDDLTASNCIKLLKQERSGIATFLPLNKMRKRKKDPEIDKILKLAGVKGLAIKLVAYDKKFEDIFSYVFGSTVIVDTLETARKIGVGRARMVSLDGDLLEPSGAMIGGHRVRAALGFKEKELDQNLIKIEDEISRLTKALSLIENKRKENERLIEKLRAKKSDLETEIMKIEKTAEIENNNEIKNIDIQVKDIHLPEKERTLEIIKENEKELREFSEEIRLLTTKSKELDNTSKEKGKKEKEFYAEFRNLFTKRNKLNEEIQLKEKALMEEDQKIRAIEERINDTNIDRAKTIAELEALQKEFEPFQNEKIRKGINSEELKKEIEEFGKLLANIGNVNLRALEIYEEIEKEYRNILEKATSLKQEKESVLNMIQEIESKKTDAFMKTFKVLTSNFKYIFSQLSTKGEATLEVENKEEPLKDGIDIRVKIASNKFLDIKSLSGGEKTLTALAFIFAIQEHKPASFYLLDEVDAALDRRNSEKLSKLIKKYSSKAQYIMISHNDALISEADQIYGVSMQENGVSKVVSLKL